MCWPGPPLLAIHAALIGCTGSVEMSVFQTLSAGKVGHDPTVGDATAAAVAIDDATATAATPPATRTQRALTRCASRRLRVTTAPATAPRVASARRRAAGSPRSGRGWPQSPAVRR